MQEKRIHQIFVVSVLFKGDKATYLEADQKPEEATFKVDATKKPKHIDLILMTDPKDKGLKIQAIYQLDGDSLTLCYKLPPPEAKNTTLTERPTEFTSAKGGLLLKLKRAK